MVVRFHCPFVGLSGFHNGGENGLTITSLITHLRDRHCNGDAQVITKQSLTTNVAVFEAAKVTFKRTGLWLCGVCFKTHTLCAKCRHEEGSDFVPPSDYGDGEVRFVLYDLAKPQVHSSPSVQLDHVNELVLDEHAGFTLPLLDILLSKRLRTVKSIPIKCRLRFSRVLKGALDKVICTPDDISCWVSLLLLPLCILKNFCPRSNIKYKSGIKRQRQEECIANSIRYWGIPGGSFQLVREDLVKPSLSWSNIDEENLDLGERNVKQCKRKIYDGHYTAAVRVLSFYGVAPYTDATLEDLKAKNPLEPAPSLPHIPIDHHQLIASGAVVLDMIKSFSRGTSCRRDSFRAQHLMDCLSGAAMAISDELVSSITQVVNLFLDGKCPKMLGEYIASAPLMSLVKPGVFGVRVSGGVEAILHVVNWLIEDRGDDIGLSMLLVDFKNAFNLLDREVMLQEVIMEDGPCRGLHLNVDKTEVFLPKEDPRSRFAGVFPPNIVRPLHDVKLLGAPASVDIDFSSELVMKRVTKSIELMDVVAKINDPQCELLLLRACAALRFDLERIVTASGPGFSDWQWRLSTLPFAFGGLGVYSAGLVCLDDGTIIGDTLVVGEVLKVITEDGPCRGLHLNVDKTEVFLPKEDPRSRFAGVFPPNIVRPLHDVKLLGAPASADIDFSSELVMKRVAKSIELMDVVAKINDPQCELLLLRACAGISKLYFSMHTCSPLIFKRAQHSFDATLRFDLERIVTASGPGFNIYGDHVVSCAGIVGIKHRHNIVRDTLVDICFLSEILDGKEVDIGLGGGRDKPLRPADMLLYSWVGGVNICVDLTGSSPLTQTGMIDFAPGRAMFEAAQRKCIKYEAKCADIGYGFLPLLILFFWAT
ncbi:hypothetical protein Tco_1040962 [Tanacetum coccineum]|uniref:Reverse transcriptase domain-containing protein n=1 Tax=Tanacetum coccineum TaxID=301880 RepID=A0ABQ5GEU0_9ASTR